MAEAGGRRKIGLWAGVITALVVALLVAGGVFRSGDDRGPPDPAALQASREQHLVPIQALLHDNAEISAQLRRSFVEYPGGIQESYFAKVLRDGPDKHRDMKDMIDRLNRNNLQILSHLNAYGEPRTQDLKDQVGFFRDHARRYDARWKALPEAAAKKTELPVAQPMFPPGFPRAVAAETAAIDQLLKPKP